MTKRSVLFALFFGSGVFAFACGGKLDEASRLGSVTQAAEPDPKETPVDKMYLRCLVPLKNNEEIHITVKYKDDQGNVTTKTVKFTKAGENSDKYEIANKKITLVEVKIKGVNYDIGTTKVKYTYEMDGTKKVLKLPVVDPENLPPAQPAPVGIEPLVVSADASEPDAGEPDASEPDAGEPDAGEPPACGTLAPEIADDTLTSVSPEECGVTFCEMCF